MRLITFNDGQEKIGVLINDHEYVDLSTDAQLTGLNLASALAMGAKFYAIANQLIASQSPKPLNAVTVLPPIPRPGKILAIGLNYKNHIKEAIELGMAVPDTPMVFTKATTCIVGPSADIHLPKVSAKLDYEAELGIVIGQRCRHVSAENAGTVIAGFICLNDISVRDWQMASPTLVMGKSFDTHCPIGPALLTVDEVGSNPSLSIQLWVNGELRQEDNTDDLKFSCSHLIEYLSTVMTLEPGDIIATGTPAGVAAAMKTPRWLKVGDTVKVTIEKIGSIENRVIAEPDNFMA